MILIKRRSGTNVGDKGMLKFQSVPIFALLRFHPRLTIGWPGDQRRHRMNVVKMDTCIKFIPCCFRSPGHPRSNVEGNTAAQRSGAKRGVLHETWASPMPDIHVYTACQTHDFQVLYQS